jgi:hypothetical protein
VSPFDRREPELTDAEIEAIVAGAIAAEASSAHREATPPSSAIVWWRAQMRARQEAARAVERPMTIAHGLAIACGVGLLLSAVSGVVRGASGSSAWLTGLYQSLATGPLASIDLTSRWVTLPLTAMLISALVASVAAYVIFAPLGDE